MRVDTAAGLAGGEMVACHDPTGELNRKHEEMKTYWGDCDEAIFMIVRNYTRVDSKIHL